ncbi:MAG: 16S rRNA (cytosine(1402)-N(4))-methyltransferase RsmH [Bacteroidales bacterium]|jgi:16S rRNA (cytosine1402-N4)-methyltransferase|nr:16S rRNA (cytosine(1402)-N(4))-methyltransferase RsmH [Paludibacteraceae bacterium]MDY6427631.1 16S rRNA (cytosine(1402)-N(4))-methyltransferase RsmH [Bacteroidales bacterium]
MTDTYHIPVLLRQSIDALDIKGNGVYADLTFGGGGHSKEILKHLGNDGRLLAFDQDKDTLANIPSDSRLLFAQSNFRYLKNFSKYYGVLPLDGILADLGVSSHHFDESERGFSFRFDGPLDMRMNQTSDKTAKLVINTCSEAELADILYYYGELQQAKRIASAVVKSRQQKSIDTIFELVQVVERFCGHDKKRDLAKIFQAIRIEVNDELEALKEMLLSTSKVLKSGGRLVVITYHSLEDRLVKNFMKSGNFEGRMEQDFYGNISAPLRPIGKAVTPDNDEIEANPRSRSAKLRIAEKI